MPHLVNRSFSGHPSVNFVKYHANANDFIIIEGPSLVLPIEDQITLLVKRAPLWCDRHRGIGADGILLVNQNPDGPEVTVINADGSIAANCGNGLRCVAHRYFQSHRRSNFSIRLGERSYPCSVNDDDVNIEMGQCCIESLPEFYFSHLAQAAQVFKAHLANQHLVFICKGEGDKDLLIQEIKQSYADWAHFNIGLVLGEAHFSLVYERGVGFTESCGSGAIAAAAALRLSRQLSTSPIKISQPGGTLLISLRELSRDEKRTQYSITQSGGATEVYFGLIKDSLSF